MPTTGLSTNETADALAARGRRHQWLPAGFDESYFDASIRSSSTGGEGPYLIDAQRQPLHRRFALQSAGRSRPQPSARARGDGEQMGRWPPTSAGSCRPTAASSWPRRLAELAERRADARSFFMLSGSDANDGAIKFARQYWKNVGRGSKVQDDRAPPRLPRGHSGDQCGERQQPIPTQRLRAAAGTASSTSSRPILASCRLCQGDLARLDCAGRRRAGADLRGPESVASVLVEPTMGVAGIVPPPAGYLARLREICQTPTTSCSSSTRS